MDGPTQILWNIFCVLVWPSSLEHHANKKNVAVFLHHNYDYFIYVIIRILSPSSLFESPQKSRHSIFLHKEILTQMFA